MHKTRSIRWRTPLVTHCVLPWMQPYGRLSVCKSAVLPVCPAKHAPACCRQEAGIQYTNIHYKELFYRLDSCFRGNDERGAVYLVTYRWIACLLALLLATGFAQAQENRVIPVKIMRPVVAPVYEELPLTGSVTTRRQSRLSPEVAGLVAKLYVDEGDEVNRGDALLELDRDIAVIDRDSATAQVTEAQARLKESLRQQNEAAQLVEKKHIPPTRYEAARATVAMDSAALERLKKELERQEELVRRHTISAPFDGVITQKMVEQGEWVKIDTPLFELTEINRLRVNVPVPQFYFDDVQLGTPVRLTFDAYPDRDFHAGVTMKIPESSETARTFPVRIDLDNSERLVAPGMSVRAVFQLGNAGEADTLLLSQDALVRKPDGSKSVWVIRPDGEGMKASQVAVSTGRAYRENIEITAGDVRAGDRVVVRGNEILRPGQLVEIKEELELNL